MPPSAADRAADGATYRRSTPQLHTLLIRASGGRLAGGASKPAGGSDGGLGRRCSLEPSSYPTDCNDVSRPVGRPRRRGYAGKRCSDGRTVIIRCRRDPRAGNPDDGRHVRPAPGDPAEPDRRARRPKPTESEPTVARPVPSTLFRAGKPIQARRLTRTEGRAGRRLIRPGKPFRTGRLIRAVSRSGREGRTER